MALSFYEPESFAALSERLSEARGGVVLAMARHGLTSIGPGPALGIMKEFAARLFGTKPTLERAAVLQDAQARSLATDWIHRDLAYRSPCMPESEAAEVVERFLGHFSRPAFYTNRQGNSWHPLTSSTFDAALLVIDAENAGLLCVQDED